MGTPTPPLLRLAATALVLCLALLPATRLGALEAGDSAPQFAVPALDGEGQLSLASYRGKVVYLDFWASWCAPCLTSLPLLDELRDEFAGDRFEVVAVNVDRDLDKARAFLRKHEIGYRSASDPEGRLPQAFGLRTMPTSFLIDAKGVVRYVHSGFRPGDIDDIRARVAELLEARK